MDVNWTYCGTNRFTTYIKSGQYAVYLKLCSAVSRLYLNNNERKKITCNKDVKNFSVMVGSGPVPQPGPYFWRIALTYLPLWWAGQEAGLRAETLSCGLVVDISKSKESGSLLDASGRAGVSCPLPLLGALLSYAPASFCPQWLGALCSLLL